MLRVQSEPIFIRTVKTQCILTLGRLWPSQDVQVNCSLLPQGWETERDTHRVCCPCQHTERGGRLGVELSAPERRSWPAGAGGWGTRPGPAAPEPAARPERLSSWLCWSRTGAGQRRWRPAAAWRCCCRSVGTCAAAPPGPPLCKVLWRQRRSSLEAMGSRDMDRVVKIYICFFTREAEVFKILPTHFSASSSTNAADSLGFQSRVWISKMCFLAWRHGKSKYIN